MRWLIGFMIWFIWSIGTAAQFQPVKLTGVLEKGPCSGAITLVTGSNARYEMTANEKSGKPGDRVSVEGKLFPRISICKSYPWIDVAAIAGDTGQAPRRSNESDVSTSAAGAAVTLVVGPDKLAEGLRQVQSLRSTLPSAFTFSVGVLGSQQEMLSRLLQATRANFALLNRIQVMAITDKRAGTVVVQDGDEETIFPNVEEFLAKMTSRAKQAN